MASRWGKARAVRADEPGEFCRLVVDEITWYMRQHKVSRADLAHGMNVSPGRVSQILSGEENLTLRTIAGVVAALGADVGFTLRPVEERADLLDEPDDAVDDDAGITSAGPAAGRRRPAGGRGAGA